MSHRFGPLTGPLDVTGICVDSSRILTGLSQYPVFKVQAQRGDTLLGALPAVNDLLLPFSEVRIRSRAGHQKRPQPSAGGVGFVPSRPLEAAPTPYPIALTTLRTINPYSVSEESAEAASVIYHRTEAFASTRFRLPFSGAVTERTVPTPDVPKTGSTPRSVRSGACPPARRTLRERSMRARRHPARGPGARRRCGSRPPRSAGVPLSYSARDRLP